VLRKEAGKRQTYRSRTSHAQEDIKQLRYFVTKYTAENEELKKENTNLTVERDTLKTNLATVSGKAADLEKKPRNWMPRLRKHRPLRWAAEVVAYKIKNSGKEVEEKKPKTPKKLKINFTIASNTVAEKGCTIFTFALSTLPVT
jgi:predicted RNase H-like nuclease (RuvC/YqgF family)